MQYDAENVFFTSDTDCSGTMECEELFGLFEANGIEVTMEQIRSLFNIVSKNGKLGLQQWKDLIVNPKAKEMFKKIIAKIRIEREKQAKKTTEV